MATKQCTKCGISKPLDQYCKHPENRDGLWGSCKACKAKHLKEWRAKNAERVRSKAREWYAANIERNSQWHKDWRLANPDKMRACKKAWSISNPGTIRAQLARSRFYDLRHPVDQWNERDKMLRVYEQAARLGFEVDHIVPLRSDIVCGLHCWANLQVLTKSENAKKKNTIWPDMPTDPA